MHRDSMRPILGLIHYSIYCHYGRDRVEVLYGSEAYETPDEATLEAERLNDLYTDETGEHDFFVVEVRTNLAKIRLTGQCNSFLTRPAVCTPGNIKLRCMKGTRLTDGKHADKDDEHQHDHFKRWHDGDPGVTEKEPKK